MKKQFLQCQGCHGGRIRDLAVLDRGIEGGHRPAQEYVLWVQSKPNAIGLEKNRRRLRPFSKMASFASPVAVSFAPGYEKRRCVVCFALSSVNVLVRW